MRFPLLIVSLVILASTAALFHFRTLHSSSPRQVTKADGSPNSDSVQNAFLQCGGSTYPPSERVVTCLKTEYETRCSHESQNSRGCKTLAALNTEFQSLYPAS